ncbi:uncharacterized protein CCR75_000661 [Bremia lactucae]|uniref:Uncharacterized protein n=1 Tax=Bremia lactucae TaxID=4779 RepID=A0A976FDA4_BRELC|nr:hypothetical protein CCR75_000661 [Bremia lactucae]
MLEDSQIANELGSVQSSLYSPRSSESAYAPYSSSRFLLYLLSKYTLLPTTDSHRELSLIERGLAALCRFVRGSDNIPASVQCKQLKHQDSSDTTSRVSSRP